jgi:hypothetical protein
MGSWPGESDSFIDCNSGCNCPECRRREQRNREYRAEQDRAKRRVLQDLRQAEAEAKIEGAAARAKGVPFHDNPYREGKVTERDWLYSAWEYGWSHGPPNPQEVA